MKFEIEITKKHLYILLALILITPVFAAVVSHTAEQLRAGVFGQIYTGNWSFMNGSVGIGTMSPSQKLHVVGTANFTSDFFLGPGALIYNSTSAASSMGQIGIGREPSGSGNILEVSHIGVGSLDFIDSGGGAKSQIVVTGSDFMLDTLGRDILVMPTSGNVGIGTTNPNKKLTVVGDANITGTLHVGSGTTVITASQVTADQFSGSGAGLTGTASSLTAGSASSVPWGGVTSKPANLDTDSTDDITTANIGSQSVNYANDADTVDGKHASELGAGWYVPTDIKKTTSSHNGNFGGYQAMYNWIQTNGCSGYHVCDNVELSRASQMGMTIPPTAWYNSAVISYWQWDTTSYYSLDCRGWTSDEVTQLGLAWWNNAMPTRYNCESNLEVLCCK